MTTTTQGAQLSDVLLWEPPFHYSRKKVTVLSGQNLGIGAVVGAVTVGTASAAPVAGNTGTGTVGTITVSAGAKSGVYKLTIIEPATDAGKFVVEDPDGITIGSGTVAVAFSAGGLAFTLADATDFVAGDAINITVAAGSGSIVEYDIDGADGRQIAAGVLLEAVDASLADADGWIICRQAILKTDGLVFASDHDANEQATAITQLEALGIVVRDAI